MAETTAMINAAKMVVQKKLSMTTWIGKNEVIHTVSDSIAALMIKVNNPNVRHVMGSDSKLTIGRTIALTRPNTTETMSNPKTVSP